MVPTNRAVIANSLEFVGRPTATLPRGNFGYGTRGRVVVSVKPGGRAEKFGVRVGWLENRINGHKNMPEVNRRKLRERPSKRATNKTVKVEFLVPKRAEYRVLWQALASDHQDIRHPSRRIVGSVKVGSVVEALDFSSDGARVFVKRPQGGWAMHSRGWLPSEGYAWMSTRARDGLELLKKIEAPKKLINLDFSDSSSRGTAHSRNASWSLPSHHSTLPNQSFFAHGSPQYPIVFRSVPARRRPQQSGFVSHATPQHPDLDSVDFSAYPNPTVTQPTPGDFIPAPEPSPEIKLKLWRRDMPLKRKPIGLTLDFKEDPRAHPLTNHPIPTRRRLHRRARSESFVLRMAKQSMEERPPLNIKITPRPNFRRTAFDLDFNEGKRQEESPSSEQKTFEMPAAKAYLGLPPNSRPPPNLSQRSSSEQRSRISVGEPVSWIIPPDSEILRPEFEPSTGSNLSITKASTVNIDEEVDPYAPTGGLEYTPPPPEGLENCGAPPTKPIDRLRVQVEVLGRGSHTPLPTRQDTPTPPSRTQGTVQKSGEISDAEEGDFRRVPQTILDSPRDIQKSDEGSSRGLGANATTLYARMLAIGRASPMSETGERAAADSDVEMAGEPNTTTTRGNRTPTSSSRHLMPVPPPELISRTISFNGEDELSQLQEFAREKKSRLKKMKRRKKVEREHGFRTVQTATV